MPKKILIPLPRFDFDPTECAVPWKILRQNEIQIQFATPDGKKAKCDSRMLTGKGLGPLAPFLAADPNGNAAYGELDRSNEFNNPISWSDINADYFDGLILPGGHAPGMREYLEADVLQGCVNAFFSSDKPIGAICHGVVLAARSKNNGQSVLKGRKTTALLATQELLAWSLCPAFLLIGLLTQAFKG